MDSTTEMVLNLDDIFSKNLKEKLEFNLRQGFSYNLIKNDLIAEMIYKLNFLYGISSTDDQLKNILSNAIDNYYKSIFYIESYFG